MPLSVSLGGILFNVNSLTSSWGNTLKIGLFQNDLVPSRYTTLGEIVPANFGGYSGLHDVVGWVSASLFGDVAAASSSPRLWVCDGSGVTNWIFGYYVLNASGDFLWAERDAAGGQAMVDAGDYFSVTPSYSLTSQF